MVPIRNLLSAINEPYIGQFYNLKPIGGLRVRYAQQAKGWPCENVDDFLLASRFIRAFS